jgi:phosphoglycerate kinase
MEARITPVSEFEEMLRVVTGKVDSTRLDVAEILSTVPNVRALSDTPRGSTVIIRADLDSPVLDGKVTDLSRIQSCLPTLNFGRQHGWTLVLLAHQGRSGESLMPVRNALAEELGCEIIFVPEWMSTEELTLREDVVSLVCNGKPGAIYLFENTRHYRIEQALWKVSEDNFGSVAASMQSLARDIASRLSDIYINEAIAASNPDFSSAALPLEMRRVALGAFLADELRHLAVAQRADAVFMSGLKANKLDDLEGMLSNGTVRLIMVAGVLAMSLKKAEARISGPSFSMGRAESDPDVPYFVSSSRVDQAERILRRCENEDIKIVLPIDFVLDDGSATSNIPIDRELVDIGPQSIERFRRALDDYAKSATNPAEDRILYYNGVPGKFEDPAFTNGTKAVIKMITDLRHRNVRVYVGGGEGRLALKKYGQLADVTHAFTAGGTVLKAISGQPMPLLNSLRLVAEGRVHMDTTQSMSWLIAPLITNFRETADIAEIERLADDLGETGDPAAIDVLLYRLGDEKVQSDPDAEDAVCSALMRLRVMEKRGNLNYRFLPDSELSATAKMALDRYARLIPSKYRAE